jgi:hypothetical protein
MDYQFTASQAWIKGDTITLTTGTNSLHLFNNATVATVAGRETYNPEAGQVSCRQAGRLLVFSIRQGAGKNIDRIVLYNVKGQVLESISVDRRQSIASSTPAATGIMYVRFLFSDGSSSSRNIVLVR